MLLSQLNSTGWISRLIKVLPVFFFRPAGVRFTGRPPCFTQRGVRGQDLSLFTLLLRPGGSKLEHLVHLGYSNRKL